MRSEHGEYEIVGPFEDHSIEIRFYPTYDHRDSWAVTFVNAQELNILSSKPIKFSKA